LPFSEVAERLRGRERVQRVPNPALELFMVRDFLSAGERAELIAMIEAQRRPCTLADDFGEAAFPTSETCTLSAPGSR